MSSSARERTTIAAQTKPPAFRFGLRSLLIIVTLCGLQFAIVARLGLLWGFGVGLAICGTVLIGLLAMAVVYARRHGTPAMDRLDRLAIQMTVAITVLANAMAFSGGGALAYREFIAYQLGRRLNKDLGFSHRTLWAVKEDRAVRVVRVTGIEPGKGFAQATVQVGDVIDSELTPSEFFRMLDKNRGREVNLTFASGSELTPIEKRSRRTVTIVVPAAQ